MSLSNFPRTYSSRNPLLRRYFWSRLRRMVQVARPTWSQFIVDLGCGKGELIKIVAERRNTSEYVGIDIGTDLSRILKRERLHGLRNMQFIRADCNALPIRSDSLSLVFCASLLEHLRDIRPALSELERVMEADGEVVVGSPSENHLYQIARAVVGLTKPKDHYHQGEQVQALLASRFFNAKSIGLPFSFLPSSLSLYRVLVYRTQSKSSLGDSHSDLETFSRLQ
jgi:ubiquinone/menaquinone biosynthesis C-methylase UbiE